MIELNPLGYTPVERDCPADKFSYKCELVGRPEGAENCNLCDIATFDVVTMRFTFTDVDRDLCPPGEYTPNIEVCLGEKCDSEDVPIDFVVPCECSGIVLAETNPFPALTERDLG